MAQADAEICDENGLFSILKYDSASKFAKYDSICSSSFYFRSFSRSRLFEGSDFCHMSCSETTSTC